MTWNIGKGKDDRKLILFSSRDGIVYKGKMIFMTEEKSLPVILDYESKKIRYICPLERLKKMAPIDLEIGYKHFGYFLEMSGEHVIECNLETFKFQYFPIDCHQTEDNNFALVTADKDQILIFTREQGKLVIFEPETKERREVAYPAEMTDICFTCGCCCNHQIFLIPKSGDRILSYLPDTETYKIYHLDVFIENSIHAIMAEAGIYIVSTDGVIYEFNINEQKIQQLASVKEQIKNDTVSRILPVNRKLLMLPGRGQHFYQFDLEEKIITELTVLPQDIHFDEKRKLWSKFCGYCEDSTYYYLANRVSNYFLRINKNTGEFLWTTPQIPSIKEQIKYLRDNTEEVVLEEEGFLEEYVREINEAENVEKGTFTNTGRKIWDVIVKR